MSIVSLALFGAALIPSQDLLIFGGTIRPGVHESVDGRLVPLEPVEAMLVQDGWIVAVGEVGELRRQGPEVPELDLEGMVLIPGLQDAHGHLLGLGEMLEQVDLVGVKSYGELIRRVAEAAKDLPPGAWIQGRGWDQTRWPGAEFPHHSALSEAVPDNPVLLERVDGHAVLVNHAALEKAGLLGANGSSPDPAGGRILRDPAGQPTGVLIDRAMGHVTRWLPAAKESDVRRRMLAGVQKALSVGLCCVHDMGTDRLSLKVLAGLREEGQLPLRVAAYLPGNSLLGPGELLELKRLGDHRFRVAGVKLMVDGALGSRGAWLLADYEDEPGHRGLGRFEDQDILRLVRICAEAQMQPAVHAIGDAACRQVLDAFGVVQTEVPSLRDLRPRLEHAQVVAAGDWHRLRALGVIPSMQPTHATSDLRWAEQRLGADRVRGAYAWRRLHSATSPLAFGSDFPVERPAPLEGIYAAMTRQDAEGQPSGGWLPDQRLSAAEAIGAFTRGAAFALGEENTRGALKVGFAFDGTVLDVDPFDLDATSAGQLLQARVLLTLVDGEIAFDGR